MERSDLLTRQHLDIGIAEFRADFLAEIEKFRVMFDRRVRWQNRMFVGTTIGCVAASAVVKLLFP